MKQKRKQRFFHNSIPEKKDVLSLKGESAHYLTRVLRLKNGQDLILFNNSGSEWEAQILKATKRQVDVKLLSKKSIQSESPLDITLLQSISRSQRMDFVMQKATELGENKNNPITSQNTVVRLNESNIENKMRHWQKIIISATEQSGRVKLPEIIELKNHPWFIGVQFHPELKSRIVNVHPLFRDFISASIKFKK